MCIWLREMVPVVVEALAARLRAPQQLRRNSKQRLNGIPVSQIMHAIQG